MMAEKTKFVILGDEYDDALREILRSILMRGGGVGIDSSWVIGGSQEVDRIQVSFEGAVLTIESETFVGLSISGPEQIVDKIVAQVRREQA